MPARFFTAFVLAIVLGISAAGGVSTAAPGLERVTLEHLDQRTNDLVVRFDDRTGNPRWLATREGTLTGPQRGAPATAARAWLARHAGIFGLSAASVATMNVERDLALPGGMHVVWLRQTWNGTAAVRRGLATFAFDRHRRLVSVGADLIPDAVGVFGAPRIDAGRALQSAVSQAFDLQIDAREIGQRAGFRVFAPGGLFSEHYVRAGYLPTPKGVRAVWDVFVIAGMTQAVRALVDADSGKVIASEDLVDSADQGLIFRYYPGAPLSPDRVLTSFEGDNRASPHGWVGVTDVNLRGDTGGIDSITTFGNNASTFLNWSNFLVPADQANRPPAPLGKFEYPFSDSWKKSECAAAPPGYAPDAHAATANLFYHHNLMHDFFYRLGFTEAAGNMQVMNFSGEGHAGDPIQGLVQAGAVSGGAPTYTGRDNAYMLTLPDGLPAWSGMFLWEPIDDAFEAPCVDGDFDASVIYHEYTHAVTNRMVPDLSGHQAGAMGEAWSDYFALDFLQKEGLYEGTALGEYVTANKERGIRNWALDRKDVGFGDMGYDIVGPQVHADGEIWAGILWTLRENLIDKYGAAEGAERARRIIVAAMPISAPEPSMVDMRDALVAAGQALYDGDTNHKLWLAFASNGLGSSAESDGTSDTDPQPGFDHWWDPANVQVTGSVVNASTGRPIEDAKILVGRYEARATPADWTDESGRFSFDVLNTSTLGAYPLTIQARGFGTTFHSFEAPWRSRPLDLTFRLRPNLASVANGAKYEASSESVADGAAALDDTEATAWNTGEQAEEINSSENKPTLTVDLAGEGPVLLDEIHISAFKNTGTARFKATRDYKIEARRGSGAFQTIATGRFDSAPPRPVTPELHYQVVRLPQSVTADTLRVTILSVQGEDQVEAELGEIQAFGSDGGPITPSGASRFQGFKSDEHRIVGANPTSDAVGGITENEFVRTCRYPPASNGLDAWVFEIPEEASRGNANVLSIGAGSPIGHDFDLYFYSEGCSSLGGAASSAANEAGSIPYGTRYVVVDQWLGLNTTVRIELTASD